MEHILVIEDEDAILDPIRKDLTHLGYKVKVAHDGEEGIELFNNGYKFDLIITDITMPRMNGNAVAKYIRSSDKLDTPIVGITGSADLDGINREFYSFILMKPFKLEALVDVIRSFT